jgi:hypothetical protein
MRSRVAFLLLCALSCLTIATQIRVVGAADHPALAGAWSLNREQSAGQRSGAPDPDRDGAPRRRGGGGRAGMGGPMGGSGIGGGMGRRPGTDDREEMERRRELMREVLEPPTRLSITVEDPLVIFTYGDGRVVRYRADGKKEKHQATSGTVETKTKWMPDHLEIETALSDGMKVTHSYAVKDAVRQLVVTVAMNGERTSRDRPPTTLVYDDVSAPAETAR